MGGRSTAESNGGRCDSSSHAGRSSGVSASSSSARSQQQRARVKRASASGWSSNPDLPTVPGRAIDAVECCLRLHVYLYSPYRVTLRDCRFHLARLYLSPCLLSQSRFLFACLADAACTVVRETTVSQRRRRPGASSLCPPSPTLPTHPTARRTPHDLEAAWDSWRTLQGPSERPPAPSPTP